jgi:hypothetical protein
VILCPHKRYKINVCHYCSHEKYPNGKPIDPTTDHYTKQTENGDWKCGVCVGEENAKLLSLFGGKHGENVWTNHEYNKKD